MIQGWMRTDTTPAQGMQAVDIGNNSPPPQHRYSTLVTTASLITNHTAAASISRLPTVEYFIGQIHANYVLVNIYKINRW